MVHISLLQGFLHPRWCRTSSINRTIHLHQNIVPDAMTPMSRMEPNKMASQGRLVQGRIFCSSKGGHNWRKWIQHQGASDQGLIWRHIKTSTAVCSRPPSKETNHFVIHSRQFLYFCAGYQKLPAMGSVFSHSHNKKKRVCNWEIVLARSSFFWGEALSLRFFALQKNPFQIMFFVNLFQSISNS